jgi:3-deoxy-D-manno-octulosonate 8-phosphate phosphatase KdsC-like HAD superfamily phosphatase
MTVSEEGLDEREEHYLDPAVVCELHAVVGDELVDLAVLVAFALGVADQDDHLRGCCLVEFMPRLGHE